MKLPNAELAIIDLEKIRDYCLNPEHPRGKHKAKVFQEVLGLTSENAEELIRQIKIGVIHMECRIGESDQYGRRYTVDIEIDNKDLRAVVRTGWIIKRNQIQPGLTTCYVK